MRVLTWIFRLFVFLVLLGFALSNTEPATLRFFGIPEFEWRAPLVLFLLVFFVAGALVGVLSAMPLVLRQRRLTSRLRKDAAAARAPDAAVPQPGSQDAASRALTVSSGGFHGL